MPNESDFEAIYAKHMNDGDGKPRFTQHEIDASIPVVFLHLLTVGKYEEFPPAIQEAILASFAMIGVNPTDDASTVPTALQKFSDEHPPRAEVFAAILATLKDVGVLSAEAVVDAGHKLKGETAAERAARTPKLGEKAPEGAIKVDKLAPKRRI